MIKYSIICNQKTVTIMWWVNRYVMNKRRKLIDRFLLQPKDFSFDEAQMLLKHFGYMESIKGKTSGSRVLFVHSKTGFPIGFDKPHPMNTLKPYIMKIILRGLKENGDLDGYE